MPKPSSAPSNASDAAILAKAATSPKSPAARGPLAATSSAARAKTKITRKRAGRRPKASSAVRVSATPRRSATSREVRSHARSAEMRMARGSEVQRDVADQPRRELHHDAQHPGAE